MKTSFTPPMAPAAPGIAAGIRTPAAARALLAVLLAPLFALMDQAVARLFGRLEDLLAQFQAGTLPAPQTSTPQHTARATPQHTACTAPAPTAAPSWLTDLINLAARDVVQGEPAQRHRTRPPAFPPAPVAMAPPEPAPAAPAPAAPSPRTAVPHNPPATPARRWEIRPRDSPSRQNRPKANRQAHAYIIPLSK